MYVVEFKSMEKIKPPEKKKKEKKTYDLFYNNFKNRYFIFYKTKIYFKT